LHDGLITFDSQPDREPGISGLAVASPHGANPLTLAAASRPEPATAEGPSSAGARQRKVAIARGSCLGQGAKRGAMGAGRAEDGGGRHNRLRHSESLIGRALLVSVLLVSRLAFGERLPIRRYTTEDGLASDQVLTAMCDDHGFMWIGTGEGLSRFDGYGFTNYGADRGVVGRVRVLLQTPDGTIWAGTSNGLARLERGASRFQVLHLASDNVFALFQDHSGRLWVGTEAGLHVVERQGPRVTVHAIELPLEHRDDDARVGVLSIAEDRDHTLWLGTTVGLVRRVGDALAERYAVTNEPAADDRVFRLLLDREGRLWVGHVDLGLWVIVPPPPGTQLVAAGDNLTAAAARQGPPLTAGGRVRWPARPGELRHLTTTEGLAGNWVRTGLFESEDGTIWVGSLGLSRIADGRVTTFDVAEGIADTAVAPAAEDSAGHLWIGSASSGVMRLARGGLVTYDERDGLLGDWINSVVDDGELYVVGLGGANAWLHRFDGRRFVGVAPNLPTKPGWGWNQITFRDRYGEWWVPGGGGLAHFPKVDRIEDLATIAPTFYRQRDGVGGLDVYRIYGDSHGDVWIASFQPTSLVRWHRNSGRFLRYTTRDGIPDAIATAFAEDRHACLFIGFEGGQVARSCGARFDQFDASDGVPAGEIQALFFDHAGRLWIGSSLGGAGRIDDPLATRLHIRSYGTSDGLSSNHVSAITEDAAGKLYLATWHGVDRLDPETGKTHHYGVADGLASSIVQTATRDHAGDLWFGTKHGLSRLTPIPDHAAPLRVLLVGLNLGGVEYPVAEQGQRAIDGLELAPDQNQLEISFVGVGAAIGQPLRYQLQLEAMDAGWSAPMAQRSIRYASLAAGRYRFSVRAISADGVSPSATVTFRVYGPIWKRAWFLALAVTLLAAFGYALYRWRLARHLEIERVRLRIAADLHDDVGSSLSRIAILSDVASREVDAGRPIVERLEEIAQAARNLVDTAGDIVWSIDPRRDDLDSLIARFRRFIGDMLDAKAIAWTLAVPPDAGRLKLSPEQRRQLFLLLKESVHNVVRHAGCRTVAISIRYADRAVLATVRDDGRGFVPTPSPRGGGLANMRARVAAAGGEVDVESAPGRGTRVRIRMPIGRRGA